MKHPPEILKEDRRVIAQQQELMAMERRKQGHINWSNFDLANLPQIIRNDI